MDVSLARQNGRGVMIHLGHCFLGRDIVSAPRASELIKGDVSRSIATNKREKQATKGPFSVGNVA